jgi:hypothetical protein
MKLLFVCLLISFTGLLILCLILPVPELKHLGLKGQNPLNTKLVEDTMVNRIVVTPYIKDGVEYLIFWGKSDNSSVGYGIDVVNHTREKMETELLRRHGGLEAQ